MRWHKFGTMGGATGTARTIYCWSKLEQVNPVFTCRTYKNIKAVYEKGTGADDYVIYVNELHPMFNAVMVFNTLFNFDDLSRRYGKPIQANIDRFGHSIIDGTYKDD